MIASRASRARRARALLLAAGPALALVLAVPAGAQTPGGGADDAGPIPLFPPTVRPSAPDAPGAAAPTAPTLDEAPRGPQWPSDRDIEVNRLEDVDADSLGVLGADDGGLGRDAWAGSDPAAVEALLRDLPGDLASPTLRGLAVRLLLSSARPPAAAPSGAAPTVADAVAAASGSDFLRLRAERLSALGELAGLNRLLSLVPQRVEDPWLAEARVDGLLLAGRDAEACAEVPAGLARHPQSLYWPKAQVYCQFVAGQTDQALLGVDLLREQAPDADPAFFRLADALAAGAAGEVEAAALTPLTLAMLRKSGGGVAPQAVDEVAPLLLHGIATLVGGDHAAHAAAVERLAEIGGLPGARLAGAYEAFEFTEADLADALAEAERAAQDEGGRVRGRALLYRAANRESLAAARAELPRAAFLSAEGDGRSHAMAQAAAPLLQEIAPAGELAWFAPLAARALYRAGQFERAGAWLTVLRVDGQRHPESLAAYEALRPLQRLAGGAEPLTEAMLSGDRGLLLFVLSRALGQDEALPPTETAGDSAEAAALPRLPHLLALGDAGAAGRRGETVLLTLAGLGAAAPADSHPLALGYAVSALTAAGLGGDARAFALEAALAAGL
jgi:hypothetical protein